ncbi:MAG TPA: 30S ribosomal protein S6 [bacterium]|nr:30S ribosomal protein S6 [bacterium]
MTNLIKEYELFYFLPIAFSPEDVASIREKITSLINKYNGTINKEEDLGKKKLSFPIKSARHGYYFLIHFSSPTDQVAQINREIELMPEIIRHRLVIKEEYKSPHISASLHLAEQEKSEPIIPVPNQPSEPNEVETSKVDMQELNRKIDELLLENI